MANPLKNEKELYDLIDREKITIHPAIWELISHYIGNDAYMIELIAGSYISGDMAEDIPAADGKKIMEHSENIRDFMNKIKKIVLKNRG